MKLKAENLRVKVVAIYNKAIQPLNNLKIGEKDHEKTVVKVIENMTVVTCEMDGNGQAVIPDKVLQHPEIAGLTRMGETVYEKLTPSFAITGVEASAQKNIRSKIYPDWAIIPVNSDGSAPAGNVPKTARNFSGQPTAFVNHKTSLVVIGAYDAYDNRRYENTEYVSVVRFDIDPQTGLLTKEILADQAEVNLSARDWDVQVANVAGQKFATAVEAALDLLWATKAVKTCPHWVRPETNVKESESADANQEIPATDAIAGTSTETPADAEQTMPVSDQAAEAEVGKPGGNGKKKTAGAKKSASRKRETATA